MTRVNISKHNRGPYKVASIDLPIIVGDVPGSIRIRCAHESACGALASAAEMAQQVMSDPSIGAVVPDVTVDDVDAVRSIAYAARAGFPTLHAASLQMTKGQRKLARALQSEARRFGGPDDDEAREVSGFFDSITDLAKSAVNSITDAADPDHWPSWLKKVAKPLSRAALDAAATAVLGPAGPVAVETMINVVDKARSGDPDAEKQIESIAKKALKGDKASKVLMSAVHQADGSTSQAPGNTPAVVSGGTFDAWMEQFGAAYQPGAFGDNADDDDAYDGDDGYSRMLPAPAESYYDGAPYPGPYADDDGSQWPVDENGQPWPADADGNPVDPNAPQVDPANVRDHRATAPGMSPATNRGAGPRGGGVTITQGAPRGGKGGFGGARDNRSGSGGGAMPQPPAWMSPQQKSMWIAAWKRAHGGR